VRPQLEGRLQRQVQETARRALEERQQAQAEEQLEQERRQQAQAEEQLEQERRQQEEVPGEEQQGDQGFRQTVARLQPDA